MLRRLVVVAGTLAAVNNDVAVIILLVHDRNKSVKRSFCARAVPSAVHHGLDCPIHDGTTAIIIAPMLVDAAGVAEVVVDAAAADDEIANGPRVKRRFDAAWQFIVLDRKKGGEDRSAKGMHNGPDWMGNEAERTCCCGQPLCLSFCVHLCLRHSLLLG